MRGEPGLRVRVEQRRHGAAHCVGDRRVVAVQPDERMLLVHQQLDAGPDDDAAHDRAARGGSGRFRRGDPRLHGAPHAAAAGAGLLEEMEIARARERTQGNRTRAAELLELATRALAYKIQEYGLDRA